MKLAEALILRADYQKRIATLRDRITRNAKVQEGDKPAEDPKKILVEVERVFQDLTEIIQRINRTNTVTILKSGGSISDAIATRDILLSKQTVYRELAKAATVIQDRSTKSEVKFKSAISVSDTQKKADDYSKQYREIDTAIQEANWLTELCQ